MATGSNKTFNAKIVGTVDIQAQAATKTLEHLFTLEKELAAQLKIAAREAANFNEKMASNGGRSEENVKALNGLIRTAGQELKNLGVIGKSVKLFKNDEIRDVNELQKRLDQLAKAYESINRQKKIESGSLGLDTTKAADAIRQLKELEKASKAVNVALSMDGSDKGLINYRKTIEANTAALSRHIDKLREQVTLEKAQEQALRMNAKFDKDKNKKLGSTQTQAIIEDRARAQAAADAERKQLEAFLMWRQRAKDKASQEEFKVHLADIAKRQKSEADYLKWLQSAKDKAGQEEFKRFQRQQDMTYRLANSGSAQAGLARTQIDFSSAGRNAAAYRTQQMIERTQQQANPVFQAQDTARRQRMDQERTLAEIYKRAGTRPEAAGFYRTSAAEAGDSKRQTAAAAIVALQQRLVDLQQRGLLTDKESLTVRTQISRAIADEAKIRVSTINAQSQEDQARRNKARVTGVGGASLLAVQASLMANYSVLNGVTGSVRGAVTGSIELEAALKNVQAVTATTSTEMLGLTDKIKQVASGSKFSATEVAGAALTLGQAGLSAKEVGESIESVTMLAAAAGTNLAQAVDLVTSVIGVYDKSATDTADIANKITQASNNSKVSVEKLALGFQYVGNTAAQAGISFEETTAAMAAMSNAGIKSGSTMGTGLRQFIVETQKPSEEFLKTINRLGLSLGDLDFKSHGLIGVSKRLREAGFIASDAIKSFDVRGAAAFNALIANPEDMQRQFELLQGTTAGIKANEIQMESLQAQTTRMTTSLVNLASVGFEPLNKVLKSGASLTADMAQSASEYTTTAKILGSVLAGAVTTGFAVHFASIAAGAGQLLGLNTALLTTVRSMTLAGAAQSALAGGKALWSGLVGTLSGVALAYRTAATQITVTAAATSGLGVAQTATTTTTSVLAGVTGVLTNAMRGLFAVIRGMSLFTGLGIVVGAAALAFAFFGDKAEATKDELDGLKAKADEAKGAFKEKTEVIKSLNGTLNDLNYKQQEAKSSSVDLRTTALELNSAYGAQGFIVNENNTSYGEMITKLRGVREEMEKMAQSKLKVADIQNEELIGKQTEVRDSSFSDFRNVTGKMNALAGRYQKDVSPEQNKVLASVTGQIANGKMPSLSELEAIKGMLGELAGIARSKKGINDGAQFSDLIKRLDPLIRSQAELQVSEGKRAELKSSRANLEAETSFRKQEFKFGDKNMQYQEGMAAYGGNMRAKYPGKGENKLDDYNDFYASSQKELLVLKGVEEQIRAQLRLPGTNKSVAAEKLTEVLRKIEGIKDVVTQSATETEDLAKADYKNKGRIEDAKRGNKKAELSADAIKRKARLDAEFKTRGIVDPVRRQAEIDSILEAGDINAQNRLDRGDRGAGGKGTQIENVEARVAKLKSTAALRAAEADKMEAGNTDDQELVQKLWDSGLKNMREARAQAVKAAEAKQKLERKNYKGDELNLMEGEWKAEVTAINADFAARIRSFMESFKGFGSAAAAELKKLEKQILAKRQEIDDQKIAGEDRVYAAGERMRELEVMQATGKRLKAKGPTTTMSYGSKDSEGNTTGSKTTFGPNGVTTSQSSGFSASDKGSPASKDLNGNAFSNPRSGSKADGSSMSENGTTTSKGTVSGLPAGTVSTEGRGQGTLNQQLARERLYVAQVERQENDKYLDLLGDERAGLIGDLTKQLTIAKEDYANITAKLAELEEIRKKRKLTPEEEENQLVLKGSEETQGKNIKTYQKELNGAYRDRRGARAEGQKLDVEISKNTQVLPTELTLDNLKAKMGDVVAQWRDSVAEMDSVKVIEGGMSSILGNLTGNLGTAFGQMVTGTKSVKSAFKDMAVGIIKSMIDIMAQAMAMQAMKGLLSFIGLGTGAAGGAAAGAGAGAAGATTASGAVWVASGGLIQGPGKVQRVRGYAGGGPVTGGISNRDSVPAMLMPGEFVMKRTAVDAVGSDYLHSLNTASNSVVSSGSPKADSQAGQPGVVNVWVVSPDQKPSGLGAKDVIVAISDDITRGGQVKKLIKQVVSNQI